MARALTHRRICKTCRKSYRLGPVLICGRPARCKRFLKKIGTWSDAAICPASDAAMELRARMGVRRPEPNHKRVL